MKSKRASVSVYGIMLALVIIILALSLSSVGKEFIDSSMNASTGDIIGLDCDNESISSFTSATCVVVDFSLFYFFGGLIMIAGILISGRIIFA